MAADPLTTPCTPISGINSNGILSCVIDRTAQTLTVNFNATTTSNNLAFFAENITNPLYSKSITGFYIESLDATATRIDNSTGPLTVQLPVPGSLAVTLTPATSVVGAISDLTVSLTMTNDIPANGRIHIILPKWNPASPSPQSIFLSVINWVGGTNVNVISCSYTSNLNGDFTKDKILVGNSFLTTEGNTGGIIKFTINAYHNPPSYEPFNFISVYTTTSNQENILDRSEAVTLVMNTMATLPATNINITAANTEVNQVTYYNFSIQVTNPLTINARILITFPTNISITTQNPAGNGFGKLASSFSTDYTDATRVLELTNIITNSNNYVEANEIIQFKIQNIKNPPTTVPTDTFTFITKAGIDYNIETNTAPVTFTATGGHILSITVTPSIYAINQRVPYAFTFVTQNPITVGSSLVITFPVEILPDSRTGDKCLTVATKINAALATCTNTSQYTLEITNGFDTAVAAGDIISFTVQGNK